MLFPFRDHNPSRRVAYVTYALLAANILVFLSYLPLFESQAQLGQFYWSWGLVPAKFTDGVDTHGIVTSMFLHGGWMHLIGNMVFLWIFGDNLEDEMGHAWYLAFYLVGGVGAGLAQVYVDPTSPVPVVGASGAVAALMGGYLLMFPKARIDVLLFLLVYVRVFTIPAFVMLAVWFGLQLFNALGTGTEMGGVAYWAHAGGFVAGALLCVPLWLRRGAARFWARTDGHPDHPEAQYRFARSSVPNVTRRR